jgi:hypothetical protein
VPHCGFNPMFAAVRSEDKVRGCFGCAWSLVKGVIGLVIILFLVVFVIAIFATLRTGSDKSAPSIPKTPVSQPMAPSELSPATPATPAIPATPEADESAGDVVEGLTLAQRQEISIADWRLGMRASRIAEQRHPLKDLGAHPSDAADVMKSHKAVYKAEEDRGRKAVLRHYKIDGDHLDRIDRESGENQWIMKLKPSPEPVIDLDGGDPEAKAVSPVDARAERARLERARTIELRNARKKK